MRIRPTERERKKEEEASGEEGIGWRRRRRVKKEKASGEGSSG